LQPTDGMMLSNSMMPPPAKRTSAHPATISQTKTDIPRVSINQRGGSGQSLNLANITILPRQKQFRSQLAVAIAAKMQHFASTAS
jgi:hypothetical protein